MAAGRTMTIRSVRSHPLYSGQSRVRGTVDEQGVVGRYRVRLHDLTGGAPVAAMLSGADGTYDFRYIKDQAPGYYAVAFDNGENPVNAAISDQLILESML